MKKKIIIIGLLVVISILQFKVYPVIKDRVRENAHEKNVENFQEKNADAEISYTVDSEADNIQSYIIWHDNIQKESFKELQGRKCISNFAIYISRNNGDIKIRVENENTKNILYDEIK